VLLFVVTLFKLFDDLEVMRFPQLFA